MQAFSVNKKKNDKNLYIILNDVRTYMYYNKDKKFLNRKVGEIASKFI